MAFSIFDGGGTPSSSEALVFTAHETHFCRPGQLFLGGKRRVAAPCAVIRCRVAGPNEVSIHEEGFTAERRNWGFLGEITNVDMMTSTTSRKPAECSRESLPLAGLVEHQTPGRPKARPKKKGSQECC